MSLGAFVYLGVFAKSAELALVGPSLHHSQRFCARTEMKNVE